MEKKNNHVGMQICAKCQEPKAIILSSKYKQNGESVIDIPKKVITDLFLCDKCLKEMQEKDHIVIFECENADSTNPKPTDRWIECDIKLINPSYEGLDFVKKHRILLTTIEDFNFILENGRKINENN